MRPGGGSGCCAEGEDPGKSVRDCMSFFRSGGDRGRQIPHHFFGWQKTPRVGSEKAPVSGSGRDVLTALYLFCTKSKELCTQNAGLKNML